MSSIENLMINPNLNQHINSDKCEKLHKDLVQDIRTIGYDVFANKYNHQYAIANQTAALEHKSTLTTTNSKDNTNIISNDSMVTFAIKQIKEDDKKRNIVHGPTFKKTIYSSKYWKQWNIEKNLLEDLTYKINLEDEKRQYEESIQKKKKKSNKNNNTKNNSNNKKNNQLPIIIKKTLSEKHIQVPLYKPKHIEQQSYFDYHLLGDTSVNYLISNSLQQKLPTPPIIDVDKNTTLTNIRIKGGIIPMSNNNTTNKSNILTSNCDFLESQSLIQSNKGSIFSTSKRFDYNHNLNNTTNTTTDNDDMNSIHKPFLLPGGIFNKSERFVEKNRNSIIITFNVPDINANTLIDGNQDNSIVIPNANKDIDNNKDDIIDEYNNDFMNESYLKNEYKTNDDNNDNNRKALIVDTSIATTISNMHPQMITKQFEYFPNNSPGPGQYNIDRIFEEKNQKLTSKNDLDMITKKYSDEYNLKCKQLYGMDVNKLNALGIMGLHCNRQEHILYGACLDGKCCRRNHDEKSFIYRNELRRLAGYKAVDKYGKHKENLSKEIELSHTMLELLPEPNYIVTPLYAAAYKGDLDGINKLIKLNVNPNIQHPDSGYTALHAAVFNYQLHAVQLLIDGFGINLDLDLVDYSSNGDTALHIASKKGMVEIVAAICEAPQCDPLKIKNKKGLYAIECVRSHKVYQYIKICQERNQLIKQLNQLKSN